MSTTSTRPRFTARHRWPALITLALLIAAATIGLLVVRPWAGPSNAEAPTVWAEITDGITPTGSQRRWRSRRSRTPTRSPSPAW